MTLPISIAIKLQQMLLEGISFPASLLKHVAIEKMLEDGVLQRRLSGKSKSVIFLKNPAALHSYLSNHFGIGDLEKYIITYNKLDLTRSDAIEISGNSKLKAIRSFKGFLVNSYVPVDAVLNGNAITLQPAPGSFTFISDWETFVPDPTVIIVGIENPENFSQVQKQDYLFEKIQPLFICRYPQSNDVINWLQNIPNMYLHFGDLDFAGINIYLNEFKKILGTRASFLIPPNTSGLLQQYGNRELYNRQLHLSPKPGSLEESLEVLIKLLHQYKMVLEQEIFIAR
ncbi:MAG: hypothetical protein V4717_06140 [Bacteroidota bacterium]